MTLDRSVPHCCRPIREYGCRVCQRSGLPYWHREGLDALYPMHLLFQGKHSWGERNPTPNEVLERLARDES